MFDVIFKDAVVAGIPLLAFVIGIVQFVKGFGLEGKVVRVVSAVTGLLFGFGFKLSQGPMPSDFAGWFAVLVFGLALGLTASGLYDAAKPQ